MEETNTRVLIVDDHQLFADVMRTTLNGLGMQVVGVAGTAAEGLAQAKASRPDLVLMDLGLPDEGGLAAGRRILEELPETKVVAVTARRDAQAVAQSIRSGFHGYVTKDTPVTQFANSVRVVMEGQVVVPRRLAARAAGAKTSEEERASLLAKLLTPQERRVLRLLVEGASSAEIAERLFVSPNTVRTHIQNILTKLQVHSRLEAAALAVRYGIITLGDARASWSGSSIRGWRRG